MNAPSDNKCKVCEKRVYEMEKIVNDSKIYHKTCFKCTHCKRTLNLGNYAGIEGRLYCKPQFMAMLKTNGNYDEGFGRQRHSMNWQSPKVEAVESDSSVNETTKK